MATYPTAPRSDFLLWCQQHAPVFAANAVAIGLTTTQATTFTTNTNGAADATLGQEDAKQASKVATQVVNESFDTLMKNAGDFVRAIRAFAENSADPMSVYNTAQIPPPATPTPAAPPAQPTNLTVTLNATDGELLLRWKATNPVGTTGTSYIIRRRLPTESDFSFVGVSGKKEFIDDSLFAGPDSVQYTVQGQRADASGPLSPVFTVNFGRLPDGLLGATVSTSAVREGIHAPAAGAMSDKAIVDAIINSVPQPGLRGAVTKK